MAAVHAMMMTVGTGGGSSIESDIYLMPNGVTVAAQPTAAKGKWHSLDGKDYYVAINSADLVSVVSVYEDLTGSGEVLAKLTRDGQTKSIPLNQVVTTFVTSMSRMFYGRTSFNQYIGSWDASSVTEMNRMLFGCQAFNQYIGSLNTSNVTDMTYMLYYCLVFNLDLSNWCVSKLPRRPIGFDSGTSSDWTTAMKPKWGAPCLMAI